MRPAQFYRLALLALLLTEPSVAGQEKSAATVAVDTPPVIDGRLDDAVWQRAPVISDLTQVEPVPGQPMTESTVVRIIYDQTALYIGVRCYDRNPGGIHARGRERDGSVLLGDHVAFFFDTFHDRRNGYVFAVSPDEGRWDALVSNHFTANTDWDGIWDVRCRTDGEGWTAEIAIPFKTLNYETSGEVWGFNFSRSIARKGESGRWRINPGLNATLSLNTDFAETEVTRRLINFNRFPLFFPEKRDFFLEDSGIYRFADLNEGLPVPCSTRRIGLSESGGHVPILGAAKLSGRTGSYEFGMTAVYVDVKRSRSSNQTPYPLLQPRVCRFALTRGTSKWVHPGRHDAHHLVIKSQASFNPSIPADSEPKNERVYESNY